MARIAMKVRDQLLHLGRRRLDPLEKYAAAENQNPVMSRSTLRC